MTEPDHPAKAPPPRPMLASLADAPLEDPELVYEPKYDGIRAIAEVAPPGSVRLWSRLGNEKTDQFPEIAGALSRWARRLRDPVVLDGEIVALDEAGEPTGFQQLQGRINLTGTSHRDVQATPVAFVVFDLLRKGRADLRDRPLLERRAALERVFTPRGRTPSPLLRISEIAAGDGRPLYARAVAGGWEGLIAKRASSRYLPGKRTPDWRKIKILQEQEFVIGGWTEPRHTRSHLGALIVGVYETRHRSRPRSLTSPSSSLQLIYAGHVGTGFTERELTRLMSLLEPLETRACPFREPPASPQKPHWVKPDLVAQVKFAEWTADGRLRQPVYLGLRDDKSPADIRRESGNTVGRRVRLKPDTTHGAKHRATGEATDDATGDADTLIAQLSAIEDSRHDAVLDLGNGRHLRVGNLHKIFWPSLKLTKGDLMRYYVRVAPALLPVLDGRPLVMKRYPNGIAGKPFYQHRAPGDVPDGVRVESVAGDTHVPSRVIGGDRTTLIYTTQLAAISQDPWFSRTVSPDAADFAAFDLDPAPGQPFAQVLEVARWIHDELDALGAVSVPKTSGADGLHIYIPLPPGTPYEAGQLFCQIVATVVAHRHPRTATLERAIRTRGDRVYIDYLQNAAGKTLASAYSVRASQFAGVSTPLTWREVHEGVAREDFTIRTMPERLARVGDLWQALRRARGVDLSRAARYALSRRADVSKGRRA